jgi:hypothetical protein
VIFERFMGGHMQSLKIRLRQVCGGIAAATLLLVATPALSQNTDTLSISGDAFAGSEGRVGVNAAAGQLNEQVNSGVIANGDTAVLSNVVHQHIGENTVSESDAQSATISGTAFSDSQGAVAVNGVAGTQNQQANLLTIGIGGSVASLEMLSQTRSSQEPAGYQNEPDPTTHAEIGPHAFEGSEAIVQVNLTAGRDNTSANLFALSITEGADQ